MKILLDTNAFLWMITDDHRLSDTARQIILEPEHILHFSAASFWEICTKKSLGKISFRGDWYQAIQDEIKTNTIQWLPIEMQHCAQVAQLPFHHRDPFDRLLIAQAIAEDLQLMSRDNQLAAYDVNIIW